MRSRTEKPEATKPLSPQADQTQPNIDPTSDHTADPTALIEALRSEVEFLREELRRREQRHAKEAQRKDRLLAAALEHIAELEAPSEPRDARERPTYPYEGVDNDAQQTTAMAQRDKRQPWQQRVVEG